jgi:CheY-like chemotaxis protein
MRGPVLADAVRVQRPGVRVLLTSGDTEGVLDCAAPVGASAFVAKPYTPAELLAAVLALLEQP